MKLYSENKEYKLYQGNMLDMLEVIEPNSIDSIVTDPPYELNFMGKGWDNSGIAFQPSTWSKCLEVLKPGGYLLAFGGSRTYHRIACAIEDAGFEIRDTIMWLYGQGFPKSLNIGLAIDKKNGIESKVIGTNRSGSSSHAYQSEATTTAGEFNVKQATNEWAGWGSALKPAFEPIIIARKPLDGSLTDNIIKHGVGGFNIDECRVGDDIVSIHNAPAGSFAGGDWDRGSDTSSYRDVIGRFPANVILTYDETDRDEVCGGFPNTGKGTGEAPYSYAGREYNNKDTSMFNGDKPQAPSNYNDGGSASRYFYCAKASKKDRDEGLDSFEKSPPATTDYRPFLKKEFEAGLNKHNDFLRLVPKKNIHPTVKPTELMQYLVRLVTPNGGTVLDPFNGSGSTGKAVMYENKERNKNYKYIGIELTPEYLPISRARIEYASDPNNVIVREETDNETEEVTRVSYKEVSLF